MADLIPVHYHLLPRTTGTDVIYPDGLMLWDANDRVIVAGDGITPGGVVLGAAGTPGADGTGIRPMGLHSMAVAYLEHDAVSKDGSLWRAKQDHTGQPPPTLPTQENAYWDILIERGTQGPAGADGENVAIIPPAEFGARPTGTTFFAFAQANYPAAWISAVVIDTEEGELQLPYNSIAGVTKIVKQADKFYIHFGTGCPAFTSGRAYFAQGVTTLDIVPVDPPPPEGAVYYGYIPASVAGDTPKVSTITQEMLDNPASSIVTAEAVALDKTSLGIVPAGALVVVAIPAASGLVATKFDGIADKVAFALNNGATNTGSNGVEVVLNSVIYKLYGEFKLNDAELFIYID